MLIDRAGTGQWEVASSWLASRFDECVPRSIGFSEHRLSGFERDLFTTRWTLLCRIIVCRTAGQDQLEVWLRFLTKVRKTPSWPRSWANFSLL